MGFALMIVFHNIARLRIMSTRIGFQKDRYNSTSIIRLQDGWIEQEFLCIQFHGHDSFDFRDDGSGGGGRFSWNGW